MPDLIYAISSFARQRGGFPPLPVINMLAETVETETTTVLQSRPGLENTDITMGTGDMRGLYQADGVLGNALFGVSGDKLYEDGTLVGTIDGNGPVSFCGYSDYIFVCAGESIWSYDGTTLSSIAFPDGADVSKILVAASRLVAIRASTGTIYWSDPLGVTIDALAFAEAENSPDTLKDMQYLGDRLILLGAETVEFWQPSEDPDLPFQPLIGTALSVGCKTTGASSRFNNGFAWVSNFNEVCLDDPNNIISSPDLQIKIRNSAEVALWVFYVDDAEYLLLKLSNETWVYGARTQVWSEFKSYGHTNWLPSCYDAGYFGSSLSGVPLMQWSEGHEDLGGVLERRFRAWTPITNGSLKLGSIALRTNPGFTPFLIGDYSDPVVELRTSRDGGSSWQLWKQRSLGIQGEYRRKVVWGSLGQFSYPGALVEIRVTDPVDFRASGLVYNEPLGGR